MAMLKKLSSIFSRKPPKPVKTSAGGARTQADKPTVEAPAGREYWAVAIAAGVRCCAAVQEKQGKRYLLAEAPRVPLPDCSMPQDCMCRFRKSTDRRGGDRRDTWRSATGQRFAGAEKRKGPRRKSPKT